MMMAEVTSGKPKVKNKPKSKKGTAKVVEKVAENVDDLAERATAIQNAQPAGKGRNVSTTAVAEVTNPDGPTSGLVGSSRDNLTLKQKAALKPNKMPVKCKGHAEVTVINAAK